MTWRGRGVVTIRLPHHKLVTSRSVPLSSKIRDGGTYKSMIPPTGNFGIQYPCRNSRPFTKLARQKLFCLDVEQLLGSGGTHVFGHLKRKQLLWLAYATECVAAQRHEAVC